MLGSGGGEGGVRDVEGRGVNGGDEWTDFQSKSGPKVLLEVIFIKMIKMVQPNSNFLLNVLVQSDGSTSSIIFSNPGLMIMSTVVLISWSFEVVVGRTGLILVKCWCL